MVELIFKIYAYVFARPFFINLNKFLYHISLRGLGVLNYKGDYLIGENSWLKNHLEYKERPVVLDMGANVGSYSKRVLEINQEATILAFEPHPATFKELISNITSEKFQAFNVGVGDAEGFFNLYDYDSNDGSQHASLYQDVITDLHRGVTVSHSVEVITLDTFLAEKNIDQIDLLKIDTEGNEYKVLQGVRALLHSNKVKAIHFEFNGMNIVSKSTFKDFWDLIPQYNLYRILPGGWAFGY